MPQVSTSAFAAPPAQPLSEHPLAIAILLTLVPPVGVVLLWASPRFSNQGKLAVTSFFGFAMLLATVAFTLRAGLCR